jgi:hypothetical protein
VSHNSTDIDWSPRAFSAPSRIGMENRPLSSSVSSPTARVPPEPKLCASAFGWNDNSLAARRTRCRVAAATSSRALSALDAVDTDTPARRATSASVTACDRRRPIENLSRPIFRAAGTYQHHRGVRNWSVNILPKSFSYGSV